MIRYLLVTSLLLAACSQKTDLNDSGNSSGPATTQTSEPHPEKLRPLSYSQLLSHVTGDLNKDEISDSVVVSIDTLNRFHPYRLLVYFGKPGNNYELAVTADNIIEPDRPDGEEPAFLDGAGFESVTIERGVLWINGVWLRGRYEHKFRYQDGNFELIGYTSADASGGLIYSRDFNLVTGNCIDKKEFIGAPEDYDPEIYKEGETRKKMLIRPLPKLQEFRPFTDERIDF
jgi:hypothetical protein